jgi:hypothetical protein
VELLPLGSKGRTEVLSDAANQGVEVSDYLKVEIVFSDSNGSDFILELLQGFRSDAPRNLERLGAVLTKHDEVLGVAHEAQARRKMVSVDR